MPNLIKADRVKKEILRSLHRLQKVTHRKGQFINANTLERWLEEDDVWGRVTVIVEDKPTRRKGDG